MMGGERASLQGAERSEAPPRGATTQLAHTQFYMFWRDLMVIPPATQQHTVSIPTKYRCTVRFFTVYDCTLMLI